MPDALYADPSERLPWLSDTARPQPRQMRRSWYPLIIAASAAGAIAFGGWTAVQRSTAPAPSVESVPLPPPRAISPTDGEPRAIPVSEREALRPPIEAETRPAASKETKSAAPRRKRASRAELRQRDRAQAPAAAAPAYDPRAWSSGVPGRIIQVGAFATPAQANEEWNRVYYRYPLLRPLPPRVVRSNIRGRTFYRLQLGTFSHAHSELLCQRLRATGEGCIVLGLPKRGRRG